MTAITSFEDFGSVRDFISVSGWSSEGMTSTVRPKGSADSCSFDFKFAV